MNQPNTKPYHLPADAVWFITGCSSGIGQSLATLIASTRTTNRLVATARNPSSLSYLPDDNPNILKLPLDVTSITAADTAIDSAVARFGRVDVFVNNAGYTLVGDTEAAGDTEARALLDTNFWGVVNVTKRALGVLRDVNAREGGGRRGGVVLQVSSMGGWNGYPGSAFYHASKFAVEGWSEAVAAEVPGEWNIHICNVEPGGVNTNYATTSLKRMERRHPAYADPSYPTNALKAYMSDARNTATWSDANDIAAAMYRLVSRGTRIPIRVPLGADAFTAISADLVGIKRDLEEFRDVSVGMVGGGERSNAVAFLRSRGLVE